MRLRQLCILAMALSTIAISQVRADLIITGVFDGPLVGGEPKVIELYSVGFTDLSKYGLGSANNGGGTDGVELVLSGSANDGQFIYVIDEDSSNGFVTYFAGQIPVGAITFNSNAGVGGGPSSINGDDAIELFFDPTGTFTGGQTVTDVFGQINVDGTGTPWDYLDGWAYRVNNTGPDGSTFSLANWFFSGINANDGKTMNVDPMRFPIGSYLRAIPEPGTGILLALVSLTGIGLARRRAK